MFLDFDSVPTSRYFFDNDRDGRTKMIEKLKNEQEVFMWTKFCEDYGIPFFGRNRIKDLNDLIIFEYKNRTGCLDDLDKYFTKQSIRHNVLMIENNSLDVSKEIDDFFEDYESSKKRLKLLFKFKSSSFDFNTKDIRD